MGASKLTAVLVLLPGLVLAPIGFSAYVAPSPRDGGAAQTLELEGQLSSWERPEAPVARLIFRISEYPFVFYLPGDDAVSQEAAQRFQRDEREGSMLTFRVPAASMRKPIDSRKEIPVVSLRAGSIVYIRAPDISRAIAAKRRQGFWLGVSGLLFSLLLWAVFARGGPPPAA